MKMIDRCAFALLSLALGCAAGGTPENIGGAGGLQVAAAPTNEIGAPGPGKGRPTAGDCEIYVDVRWTDLTPPDDANNISLVYNLRLEVTATWAEGVQPQFPLAGRAIHVVDQWNSANLEMSLSPDAKAAFDASVSKAILVERGYPGDPKAYVQSMKYYVALNSNYPPVNPGKWTAWSDPGDYLPLGEVWHYAVCDRTE